MDRSLDEIVAESQRARPRGPRRGGRRNDRNEYPRDGVRKSTREDSRNLDSEWVHDKYDDDSSRRPYRPARRHSPDDHPSDTASAKLRVENIHYDLTEDDLDDLFNRIGPVLKLDLRYDRAGRSEGVAYVTYEYPQDARRAIREFDGANANGQPIRLVQVPMGPSGRRNPFDSAVRPAKSLADRITIGPGRRARSDSPIRHSDVSGPPPANIDRYVPGQDSRPRSPRRREGRPPGARRERGRGGGAGREGGGRGPRPKKTAEELDAEMEDYFVNGGKEEAPAAEAAPAAQATELDVEMAE